MALAVRIIQNKTNAVTRIPLDPKKPLRLKAALGDKVVVVDAATDAAVAQVEVTRNGSEIQIRAVDKGEVHQVILEDGDGKGISVFERDEGGKYIGSTADSWPEKPIVSPGALWVGDEGAGWLTPALLGLGILALMSGGGGGARDTTPPVVGGLDVTDGTDSGADDLVTNDGNPVLEFTGEAGLTITLKGADGSLLAPSQYSVAYAGGKYTVTLLDAVVGGTPQSFGTYDANGDPTNNAPSARDGLYTIVATDSAGNQANVGQFEIDTTPPVVSGFDMTNATDSAGTSQDDEITNNGLPVLTFRGEAGLTVTLEGADGDPLVEGTHFRVDYLNGTYTVTLLDADPSDGDADPFGAFSGGSATRNSLNTADGTYTLSVADVAGNTQVVGTFVIDTTAPATPTVDAQSTSDRTPVITGTADVGPGEVLTVEVDGTTYTAADGLSYNSTTGVWSLTIPTDLATNRTYNVIATVTDAAGNASPDATAGELVIDTAGPVTGALDITTGTDTGANDLLTKNGLPVLQFTGEPGLDITLKGADGFFLDPSQYTVAYVPINGTSGTYTVTLRDAVTGDVGQSAFGTYDGSGNPTGNPRSSADGTYTIVATDSVGNSGDVGQFVIDTTRPVVSNFDMTNTTDLGVSQDDEITNFGFPVLTFSGEASPQLTVSLQGPNGTDLILGTHYRVDYLNGTYTVTLLDADPSDPTADPFGTFLEGGGSTGNGASTRDGTYTLTATDAAGNSQQVGTFVIDTTPPAVRPTVDALTTTSNFPTLTGTATLAPGELLTITVSGATYTVTPDGSGNWSLDLSTAIQTSGILSPLFAGSSYEVVATVTDAAGLSISDSTTTEVTVNASVFGIVSIIYFNDFGYFKTAGDPLAVGGTRSIDGAMLVQFNNAVATNFADGTKITWDINSDGATTADFTFLASNDLTGQGSGLSDRLFFVLNPGGTTTIQTELETLTPGFGSTGSTPDNMDFASGVGRSLSSGTLSAAASDIVIQYYWKAGDGGGTFVGSNLTDKLVGGSGADVFDGLAGSDTFTFGAGADTLRFSSTNGADTVTDYSVAEDSIVLLLSAFTALSGAGALASTAFVAGTAAADADDRIIYDISTGNLYYDADGSGGGAATLLATFTNKPALVASEFTVI